MIPSIDWVYIAISRFGSGRYFDSNKFVHWNGESIMGDITKNIRLRCKKILIIILRIRRKTKTDNKAGEIKQKNE